NIKLSGVLGTGAGVLLPRTHTRLLQNDRHDEFHLSGFGTSAVLGGKAIFFNTAFIQTELKGGYYNMPSILTTQNPLDHASQSFFSVYYIIVVELKIILKGK